MLLSPDTFELISDVPHKKEFTIWKYRLTASEYAVLIDTLTKQISGVQICTSSWIPGSDWTNTPFQIIYEKACNCDEQHSAMFFGLVLWDAIMQTPDSLWSFTKQPHIKGTTYFRVVMHESKRRELYFQYLNTTKI